MRTTIPLLALLLAVLTPSAAVAEWKLQSQGLGQKLGFLDISAVSPTFAVAVGVMSNGSQEQSVAMFTRDGVSWQQVTPIRPTGQLDLHIFTSVLFVDDKLGFIGGIGEILTTKDGGGTWERIDRGGMFGSLISDIHSGDPISGVFAVTSTGEVLRSVDGGVTWPTVSQPLGEVQLNRVHFIDALTGWVTAGKPVKEKVPGENQDEEKLVGYKDGAVLRTTDGGGSWETLLSGEERTVNGLIFVDAKFGWITSNSMSGPRVQQTNDGGQSWTDLPLPMTTQVGELDHLVGVHFFNRCEGWLLGGAGEGDKVAVLWHTVDGGQTWTEVDRSFLKVGEMLGFPIEVGGFAMDFFDRSTGWLTGNFETIFRYDADTPAPTCNAQDPEQQGNGSGGTEGEDPEASSGGCRVVGGQHGVPLTLTFFAALLLLRRRWR